MTEIWKDVSGYEGYYKISNLGRLKSLKRSIMRKGGKPLNLSERILKKGFCTDGYVIYNLNKNNKRKTVRAHRLVAEAFIPNLENKLEVNHINGIKTDNSVENLEWCTHLENQRHAWATKLKTSKKIEGENNYQTHLKKCDILKIRELYKTGEYTLEKLGDMYNVHFSTIGYIIRRKTWKHI